MIVHYYVNIVCPVAVDCAVTWHYVLCKTTY